MITLNLTAKTQQEIVVKEYLERNVSAVLADKINNGAWLEKDGKRLLNKKSMTGFMNYACAEAQKIAEKGARSACHGQDTVFGWAIHYFEEDSIEGALFNEDGTEYKPKPVIKPKQSNPVVTAPPPKPKPQMSLFDVMDAKPETPEPENESETGEEPEEFDGPDSDCCNDEPEEEAEEICRDMPNPIPDSKPDIAAAKPVPQIMIVRAPPIEFVKPDAKEDIFGDKPAPRGLRQISETDYVDDDGVIYKQTPPQAEKSIPDVLVKIFGGVLRGDL